MPTWLLLLIVLAIPAVLALLSLRAAREDLDRDEQVINRLARGDHPDGGVGRLLAAWRDWTRR